MYIADGKTQGKPERFVQYNQEETKTAKETEVMVNEIVENTVEEVEEMEAEAGAEIEMAGLARRINDLSDLLLDVAEEIHSLDHGAVQAKGEFKKRATELRLRLRPSIQELKDIRQDMLTWKAESVEKLPGARKSKTKEQLIEEAEALRARAESM